MHLICSLEFCITFVFHSQPRSQGSLLPALRSERERESERPWKTLVTYLPESLSLHRVGEEETPRNEVGNEKQGITAVLRGTENNAYAKFLGCK